MKKSFIKYIIIIMVMNFSTPLFAVGREEVSSFQTILNSIFYIGIFIIVIFVTLYGTKLIAKNYKGYSRSKYINLLDTLNIPGGTKITIMEINKKIYIISITPNSTEVIDILNEEEFLGEEFNSNLEKYTNKNNAHNNFGINKIIEKFRFSKDKEEKK